MLSPPPATAIMARRGVKGLLRLHLNVASYALAKNKYINKYTQWDKWNICGLQFLRAHCGVTLLIGTYLERKVKCLLRLARTNICFFLKFSEALNIV